jgi:hypothetical protein
MIVTRITDAAQEVLELVGALSLPAIGLPIAIFLWSLLFKGEDNEEDWTVNLAVSLKVGGVFLLLALSILLNAAGSEIRFLMRVERLWGGYVLLLVVGSLLMLLAVWVTGRRFSGIQLNEVAGKSEVEPRRNRAPLVVSWVSLTVGWLVAIVWLWAISQGV